MKRLFWTLLVLSFLTRLILLFAVPLNNQASAIPYFNDEAAHLNYVKYLANHHRLPVQETSVQVGAEQNKYEYYQPPLYYSLMQPFYSYGRSFTPGFELFWVRFGSLMLSLAGLTALYFSVRRHFGETNALAVLLLGGLSGIPLRFGALVTNDSLLFCLSCFFFSAVLHIALLNFDRKMFWALLIVVTAGLWTKISFIILLPVYWGVLYYKRDVKKRYLMAAILIPFLCLMPWMLHNMKVYGGILPLNVGFGEEDVITGGNINRLAMSAIYFLRSFHLPYDQLWGGYLDKIIYPLLVFGTVFLITSGIISLKNQSKAVLWIAGSAISLNLIAYLSIIFRYYQSEARFLLPVMPFILLLIASGAQRLSRNRLNWTIAVLFVWITLPWLAAFV